MRHASPILAVIVTTLLLCSNAHSQWRCLYATYDDASNGTGHNTVDVGVVSEDVFVAVVWTESASNPRGVRNFLVPYSLADSSLGRLWDPGYGGATAGIYQSWSDGAFDEVGFSGLLSITATADGVVYGVNNDAAHNLLVFKLENDTVSAFSPFYRMETGPNSLSAVEVDAGGYVYVLNDTTSGRTDDIKIYPPLAQWSSNQMAPMQTIDLPDGVYKGIATNPDGSMLFVADYDGRSVLKFTGSPSGGYSPDAGFSFALTDGDTVAGRVEKPGMLKLAYKSPENILFAASDIWLKQAYEWGRIYLLNPITGALISGDSSTSLLDAAKWNFEQTGVYNNRVGGTTPGNASGYTSTFDVEFDENGNVYTQSHYGWTVEKWTYQGTLPTISLSSVEPTDAASPRSFSLAPNYPNPFNPSTTIEFSVDRSTRVRLEVTDILGRVVSVLTDGEIEAGSYKTSFDATGLSSGVYFARLSASQGIRVRQMLLTR